MLNTLVLLTSSLFMELRHTPIPLRAAFEVYCVGMWGLLSGLYLWL